MEEMSRKALEMEPHSPYSGYVRGSWRKGSYTEDFETCNGKVWK
jgi:hypothetical protein